MYILIWVGLSTWYIYIFIIQYSLVGGFNPSEKKTTLSQLGLSFPKYGVTVIQTTSWIHLFAVICTYHMCLRTMLTQHVLDKTLTPPCANQGFAYAKCSYDRALFPNNSNRFLGSLKCSNPPWAVVGSYSHCNFRPWIFKSMAIPGS